MNAPVRLGLTEADHKHWAPIPQVVEWLVSRLPAGAKVLEIGPGFVPFPLARTFVDIRELPDLPGTCYDVDVNREPLPFYEKEFDFCYARHVLEDMWNPFNLIAQMSRIAKSGYIETPSPIAECCKGVDGGSPPYHGYHHHRFMVWDNDGELTFVSKFPVIEHLAFRGNDAVLRAGPLYWNTYFLWTDDIRVRHLQCPADFDIMTQYGDVLATACHQAKASCDRFAKLLSQ